MNGRRWRRLTWLSVLSGSMAVVGTFPGRAQQQPRPDGTLVIAGQPEQASVVRINGRSYVDLESLARIAHGTLQFQGSRTILTLPGTAAANAPAQPARPPRLTEAFLSAEIEALTQIREWHVSLLNAVQNNYPVAESWVGPIQRAAEAKLQLALAAATSDLDQKAAELLRNEFTNMQQISDQLLQLHAQASLISPDIFNNNTLDAKILGCERALAGMAASKQFQDEPQCH